MFTALCFGLFDFMENLGSSVYMTKDPTVLGSRLVDLSSDSRKGRRIAQSVWTYLVNNFRLDDYSSKTVNDHKGLTYPLTGRRVPAPRARLRRGTPIVELNLVARPAPRVSPQLLCVVSEDFPRDR